LNVQNKDIIDQQMSV